MPQHCSDRRGTRRRLSSVCTQPVAFTLMVSLTPNAGLPGLATAVSLSALRYVSVCRTMLVCPGHSWPSQALHETWQGHTAPLGQSWPMDDTSCCPRCPRRAIAQLGHATQHAHSTLSQHSRTRHHPKRRGQLLHVSTSTTTTASRLQTDRPV